MSAGMWSRFKQGMKTLPPWYLLKAKRTGVYGTIFGLIFGGVFMMLKGLWYFIFVLVFVLAIQVIEAVSLTKQINQSKQVLGNLRLRQEKFSKVINDEESRKDTRSDFDES